MVDIDENIIKNMIAILKEKNEEQEEIIKVRLKLLLKKAYDLGFKDGRKRKRRKNG